MTRSPLRNARCRRALCQALVAIASAGVGGTAYGSPSARLVYLRGAGAETCPAEPELRKAVSVRIGYDPFFPAASKTVVAEVTRAEKGFHGKVQIVGDDGNVRGQRELATKGDDCGELMSAIALAVSIALDDLDEPTPAPTEPAPTEPAPPPVRAPEEGPPPPTEHRARPDSAERRPPLPATSTRTELGISAGPTLSVGTGPAEALGASLAGSIRWTWLSARIDLRGELPASGELAVGAVETRSFAGTLAGCVRGAIPFACLGGGGGIFASKTSGIERGASDAAPFMFLVGRAGADIPLGSRIYVEPFAEGAVNLARHAVQIDNSTVYRMPPTSATFAVHVGGHFL